MQPQFNQSSKSRFSEKHAATQNVSARSDNKHSIHSDNEEDKVPGSQEDTFRSFDGGNSARKDDMYKSQDKRNEDKATDLMIRINQKSAKFQKKDNSRVDYLRKRENQQIKKRNQVV